MLYANSAYRFDARRMAHPFDRNMAEIYAGALGWRDVL